MIDYECENQITIFDILSQPETEGKGHSAMSKEKEIMQTKNVVREILESDEKARNSDDYLILEVCKAMNPDCVNLPFETVLRNRKALGLPVFETIRRTGQRTRAENPELAGNIAAEVARDQSEEAYRKYANGLL